MVNEYYGENTVQDFGEFIKQLRIQSGLTQTDVQRFLNLDSTGIVSHWEHGRSFMSDENARLLARLYRIDENLMIYRLFCAKKLIPTIGKWRREYIDCEPVIKFIKKCKPPVFSEIED